jgi:two-component system, cell cycle sensor histidine kinase and response regulator CckA
LKKRPPGEGIFGPKFGQLREVRPGREEQVGFELNSNGHMSGKRFAATLKLAIALAAPFCAAALGYLIGIRQTQPTTGAPQKTYELNIGLMHLVLTAGVLGITVMFVLTVLLSIVILLTIVAGRKRSRADEARHRALFEYAPDGIVIADPESYYLDANSSMCRMLGYTRDELVGLHASDIVVQDEIPQIGQALSVIKTKSDYHREWQFRRKDGSVFSADVMATTMPDGNLLGIIRDITERKKMEEQLRLSQRMEAIGRLAGGVAHDFNNLLAVILGCADVMLDELAPDHPAAKRVEMIRKAGASAADLTRQLLAFSRQQLLQPQVLDLKQIVERAQVLLTRLIGDNIELRVSLEPSLWNVKADPGQIEQVLLNLAVNAKDAMPQGGRLTIQARNVELDASYVEKHRQVIVNPGPYVMLVVEDTGSGMDHETQSRIFDPFFTTKELGKGTGLGLATVYGIVKQSGGYIWVYSELGHGTVFKVYLPRVENAAQPVKNDELEGTFGGTETILLAEDSASLREMAREYLESVGYTVLEAATGKDALDQAKSFAGTIQLLLTDVVMPGMSGPELAHQIGCLRPGIKIIFTSGYTDDAIIRQGVLDPAIAFIQKPYRPKALARKIREVLKVNAGNVMAKS